MSRFQRTALPLRNNDTAAINQRPQLAKLEIRSLLVCLHDTLFDTQLNEKTLTVSGA